MPKRRTLPAAVLAAALFVGACSSDQPTASPTTTGAATTPDSAGPGAAVDQTVRTLLDNVAERYRNAEGRWPGFDPGQHPTVVPFRDDGTVARAIAIDHPDPDALGTATPIDIDGLPFAAHLVIDLADPAALEDVAAFEFTSQQGGVSSFVIVADADDDFLDPTTEEFAATLVHEMFHRHQILSFDESLSQDFESYAYTAANFELATLEERALAAALDADTDEARDLAARRFVAIRMARRAAEPSVGELDDSQEASEGTARWIEHATAADGSDATYLADNFARDLQTDLTQVLAVKESFAFGRFYASGAAVVELLDRMGVDDRARRIQDGEPPAAVLADALGVESDDVAELVAEARTTHDPDGELPGQAAQAAETAAGEPPVFSEDGGA